MGAEQEGGICTSAGVKGTETEVDGGSLATLVNGGAMIGDKDGVCATVATVPSKSVLVLVLVPAQALSPSLGGKWKTLRPRRKLRPFRERLV